MRPKLSKLLRPAIVAALMTVCVSGGATSIYKCVSGGKVTYSGTLCTTGSMKEMRVKVGPQSSHHDAQRVQRQQKVAAELKKERLAREAAQGKSTRGNAAAAARERRCARLRLGQKRADAKVDAASSSERENMRVKAVQHRETMAIECPA